MFVPLHAAQTHSLQSWASPHRPVLDPYYSRVHFGSRRLHLWVSTTFSESILLFVFLITSAPLAHIQWRGEAGIWRQMLEEEQTFPSAKSQDCWRHCLTELLLTVGKEEPQRSFRLHLVSIIEGVSRLCLQSIFVQSSYHASQHAAAPWTGPENWSGWKLTQLKGGKRGGKKISSFLASSALWSHLPHSSTNSRTTTREVTSSHRCQLFLRQQPKPLPYGPAP